MLALLLSAALGAAPAGAAWETDSRLALEQLESRLLAARRVLVESELRASGAVTAELRGTIEAMPRNGLKLAYAGTLAGRTYELRLESDARRTVAAGATGPQAFATGAESNRAVLLALTRMGLLHNLLRLAHGQPPDRAQGGVAAWLAAEGFQPATYALDGPLEGALSFGFETVVGGRPVAEARLWLDPARGLPLRREQVFQLEGGAATVVEEYRSFVID